MICLNYEHLKNKTKKILCNSYLLFGNDLFYIQKSKNLILNKAKKQQFNDCLNIIINSKTNWDIIFNFCKTYSLLSDRKIIILTISEFPISILIEKKIFELYSYINKDLIIILLINKSYKIFENSLWFKVFKKKSIIVNNVLPKYNNLFFWIKKESNKIKISLDDNSCYLLCDYYEGNIFGLIQILKQLLIIYPNKNLTFNQVKSVISNIAKFTPDDWINFVLLGDYKKAFYILHKLKNESINPIILLYKIYKEIYILLTNIIKIDNILSCKLINNNKIFKYHKILIDDLSKRITLSQIKDVLFIIIKIELIIKQNYNDNVWFYLNILTLILSGKTLTKEIIYD